MKILETDQGWAIEHNGRIPIPIGGTEYFDDYDDIAQLVAARGLHIWSDGSLEKEPEAKTQTQLDEEWESAAPVQKTEPKRKPVTEKVAETTSPAEPAKRGRPRKFSEEEAKERRREKAREYSANRSEEQKAAARERSKRWRENNPDKVKEARDKSVKARADRYANDPEYRKQFNEYQREYKRGQRGKN